MYNVRIARSILMLRINVWDGRAAAPPGRTRRQIRGRNAAGSGSGLRPYTGSGPV